jgi:putative NIF3 family GTP cyclohydrolase 1 type 2
LYVGTIIAKKDIAIVSMHTNYDISHLNRYVLEEVLGYEVLKRDGYLLYFEVDRSFNTFARELAYKLNIDNLRVVKKTDWVDIAAITTGSGSELMNGVDVDCFITGDIKYHSAKEAFENSLSLIDIQHYESEIFFAQSLQRELENYGLFGIIANSKNPFSYISKDIHE